MVHYALHCTTSATSKCCNPGYRKHATFSLFTLRILGVLTVKLFRASVYRNNLQQLNGNMNQNVHTEMSILKCLRGRGQRKQQVIGGERREEDKLLSLIVGY